MTTAESINLSEFRALRGAGWEAAARSLTAPVRRILEKVLASERGSSLSEEECLLLAHCSGRDMLGMLVAADHLRRTLVGDVVTYVVTRNINFTNVCFVGCKFCAFSRGRHQPDAYFLSLEELAEKARQAAAWGATEVCIQGGLPRELPQLYYRDILRAVRAAAPEIHIHAFSPMEIRYGVERSGMTLPDYLFMLKQAGLNTIPGTAAEILDDEIRHLLSRNKLSTREWRNVITTAHRCGIPTTSTMMYGHVESPAHWVRQLRVLAGMQAESGGFTEFVPLGFVHQNTLLFRQGIARPGPTVEEHLKVHALARILLAGRINNIQVSWVKLGYELSQLCLEVGANDYGGTLFEENISRLAGATAGQYVSAEEFEQRIARLGRIPAERNTLYQHLRRPRPAAPLAECRA